MGNYVRDTLLNGEVLIYEAKTTLWSHWLLLLTAFVCFAGAFASDNSIVNRFLIGAGLGFVLIVVVQVQTTELSLTNKRVVAKHGVLARHLIELKLDRIESTRIRQSLTGRLFNYGSLLLAGSGNPVAPIASISNPLEFRRVALEAQEESLAGSSIRTYSPDGSGSKLLALVMLVLIGVGLGLAYRFLIHSSNPARKPAEIVEGGNAVEPSVRKRSAQRTLSYVNDSPSNAEPAISVSSFNRYENSKHGYQLVIPSTLKQVVNQSGDDGERFVSSDSEVSLSVLGANTSGESLEQLYQTSLDAIQGEVGYHVASKNWFVISSKSGDTLRYQKTFAGSGSSNTFVLTFPETEKAKYVPVIEVLEKSFRHGDLEQEW